MESLKCREILEATGGTLAFGDAELDICSISTDSRRIGKGALFIPIAGERFDGHDFITSSLEAGAAASLTQSRLIPTVPGKAVIRVCDTVEALGKIAKYYRKKFGIPFVGITGSVGKTSTKDMVAEVLACSFNVLKTKGNFNNEIGLPLTIFNIDRSHEAAVIEMGMSGFGEISRLTSIVRPNIAIITNIGLSHIEKLGSRQNILKAKLEILEGLDNGGIVVLNGDDKLLYGIKDLVSFKTIFYGMEEGLDYQAFNIKTEGEKGTGFELTVNGRDYKIHVPVPGLHNVYNALAAVAAGLELGMDMDSVINGIARFTPSKMRMDIIKHKGATIINDTYNASPQSMEAAINVLKEVAGSNRTIAVLGDMLEMGEWAFNAHVDVGIFAVSREIDYILTVGESGRNIAVGAIEAGAEKCRVHSFEKNEDAAGFLKELFKKGDVILVKGSRGMKMEEIIERFTA